MIFLVLQSIIGHCLGAAGAFEAIATVKAIETGWLHPTINQFVSLSAPHLHQLFSAAETGEEIWEDMYICMYVSLITKCNLPCKYTTNSLLGCYVSMISL